MDEKRKPATYPASKARQGYVVLKTPLRRAIFFGGLIGLVVLSIVLALA
ncbi:peptide ABC transporter permease [Chelativorans sp. YIM 93263]|nr:peptide ABC transporter permease [Chelativorans sp. YIM 93263]